jgi:hypothetical protein
MYNTSTSLFTNVIPTTRLGKVIQFPLLRILIVIVFLFPVTLLANLIGLESIRHFSEPFYTIIRYGRDFFFLISFMIAYGFYTKYVERREANELSFKKFYKELGLGALLSFCTVAFMVLLMAVLGYYKIASFNPLKNLSDYFMLQMMVGFTEELIFRVILFKLSEELLGSWIAIIIQGLIFGFAHMANPNASFGTSVGLVISDTLLLGGAFMLTRRIWLVMGLHWSWNFFQAGVFGMPNSGKIPEGWITPTINGPTWITGGAWGIEASYLAILILFIMGLYVFKKAIKNGQLVHPMWKRKKKDHPPETIAQTNCCTNQ